MRDHPLKVSCRLKDHTLFVIVHVLEISLPLQGEILAQVRQMIANEASTQGYSVQPCLMVHETETLESSAMNSLFPAHSSLWLIPAPSSFLPLPHTFSTSAMMGYLKQPLTQWKKEQLNGSWVGVGLGIVLGMGVLYGLTRPCVIGSCSRLPQAQVLAQQSLKGITKATSEQTIITAQQHLNQAISLLSPIPPWSGYHQQARRLMLDYQLQSEKIATWLGAIQTFDRTKTLINQTPLSLEQWQEIQSTLQKAIATLEALSSDNTLFLPLDRTIGEYKSYLNTVESQLIAEKSAQTQLNQGIEAAKLAQLRQKNAQSLQDWQLVVATWQTAIERLQGVSSGTTRYQDSRQLLDEYRGQWIQAEVQRKQEETAVNLSKKSQQAIKSAKVSESQKQWSAAVRHWRNALSYIRQIPANTFYYQEIQPKINDYTLSLQQAETQLQKAVKLQQIHQDLTKICSGAEQACTYSMNDTNIQVKLTESYRKRLWETALYAKAQANVQTQAALLNHLSHLEQSLRQLSQKTGKSIALYQADGELMMTFEVQ